MLTWVSRDEYVRSKVVFEDMDGWTATVIWIHRFGEGYRRNRFSVAWDFETGKEWIEMFWYIGESAMFDYTEHPTICVRDWR